jgi:ankyrin repeat protein
VEQAAQLFASIEAGDLEVVSAMLRAHPELVRSTDESGRTPLHAAAAEGHLNLAHVLLDAGADVNSLAPGGVSVLSLAMGNHLDAELKSEMLAVLERRGASYDIPTAIISGDNASLEAMLAAHLGAVAIGGAYSAALHLAVQYGRVDAAGLLLSHGADPNTVWHGLAGATPLHVAAFHGDVEMLRLLLSRGARVDALDAAFGATALEWAESSGKQEAAQILRQAAEGDNPRY